MTLVVIDTNVLVAGLINPRGPSALVLNLVAAGILRVVVTEPIFDEYARVLGLPGWPFRPADKHSLLELIDAEAVHLNAPRMDLGLGDPSDEPFLSAAIVSRASYLITSNIRHFPPEQRRGVHVILPRPFTRRFLPGMR